MHIKIILRLLSAISLMVCVFMLPCVFVALYFNEHTAIHAFLTSMISMILPSVPLLLLLRKKNGETLSSKDGFLLVFLSWLSASLFASIPFYLSGSLLTWGDAFFEAASGISTTGATVITNIEVLPNSIILWRSIAHWMGGMGIVVLSVALMPLLGIGGMQLFKVEASGRDEGKLTPRIAQTAKYLWLIYTGFTVISFILLLFGGMGVFDAVNHAMSSIASGGFSSKNSSMGHFDDAYIQWVTIGSMFIAGISFSIYYRLFTGKLKHVWRNTELKAYIFIIICAGVFVSFVNWTNGLHSDPEDTVRHAFFQVVSVITSTGYASTDYSKWPNLSQYVLFILMLMGGCAGSTAGGIKVVRIVVMLKQAINEMRRLVHPRGVFTLRLNGAVVKDSFAHNVAGFFFLYIFSVLLVMFVASTAEVDLLTAFTTGLATIGNIGPGFGLIGPENTYALYPEYVKWVLGLAMIVGRLEMYTFFILLMPFFWKR